MKSVVFVIILGGWAAVGCSKNQATSEAAAPSGSAETLPIGSAKTAGGTRAIQITAGDNMKFNVTQIVAAPGEELKIALQNTGTIPGKEIMAHNFVLLKAGSDPNAYAGAAVLAKATDYVPPALNDQVIAHTKLLGAKQSDEITFKAPTAPGEYPYLCSFPAHYASGMKGVLVVK
jgi:azurin